jgi:hypothetical protein
MRAGALDGDAREAFARHVTDHASDHARSLERTVTSQPRGVEAEGKIDEEASADDVVGVQEVVDEKGAPASFVLREGAMLGVPRSSD